MKTKQLQTLLTELSDLNNSFTHYFFVWTQFNLDYKQNFIIDKDKMTSNIFKENNFSKKHNIKLAKLGDEHIKTNDTLLNGIFTLIYSSFENYLSDIYSLVKHINKSLPELNENKYEEDDTLILKILNRLDINKAKLGQNYLLTLDYIRFKRNRLIHKSSSKISRSLRDIINNNKLNSFWNEILPKQLQGIDFSNNENANQITYNILIDSINIIRGIANFIDKLVLETIDDLEFLLKEVLVDFKETNGYKTYNLHNVRNKKKFIGFCKSEYGFEPTEYDLSRMV